MFKKFKRAVVKLGGELKKALSKPGVQSCLCACAAFVFFLAELAELFCMFPYYYNECEYPRSMQEAEE